LLPSTQVSVWKTEISAGGILNVVFRLRRRIHSHDLKNEGFLRGELRGEEHQPRAPGKKDLSFIGVFGDSWLCAGRCDALCLLPARLGIRRAGRAVSRQLVRYSYSLNLVLLFFASVSDIQASLKRAAPGWIGSCVFNGPSLQQPEKEQPPPWGAMGVV
jgi:hypothetical protein